MVLGQRNIEIALIIPQIQICLSPIVKDKDLAVLERVHSSGINIHVGVDLDHGHFQTHGLEEEAGAGGCRWGCLSISFTHIEFSK